jgi:hypothetical protein
MTESSTIKNIGDNVRAERHYHRRHEKSGVDYVYLCRKRDSKIFVEKLPRDKYNKGIKSEELGRFDIDERTSQNIKEPKEQICLSNDIN